jgi:hypothetical protein
MGAGAFLAGRTKPAGELSRYLLWRGLWLIALEVVVVRCLGLQFNVDYRTTMLTVCGRWVVDDRARRSRASAGDGRRNSRRRHDRGAQPV